MCGQAPPRTKTHHKSHHLLLQGQGAFFDLTFLKRRCMIYPSFIFVHHFNSNYGAKSNLTMAVYHHHGFTDFKVFGSCLSLPNTLNLPRFHVPCIATWESLSRFIMETCLDHCSNLHWIFCTETLRMRNNAITAFRFLYSLDAVESWLFRPSASFVHSLSLDFTVLPCTAGVYYVCVHKRHLIHY